MRAFSDLEGVRLEVVESALRAKGDGDRLVQVLVNLISNAVKFSPRGSVVSVSAALRGPEVEFRVADQGRGVPPHMREAIFERFRQVEASDARHKGGTGLGLAICKMIVEGHGGTIGLESEEGRGSVFWFRIPAAPAKESRPAAPAEESRPAAPFGPPCIPWGCGDLLVVEEDRALLGVLERQLGEAGFDVRCATTGREAVALARQRPPSVLILDVGLPDGDGFDVVRTLRHDPRCRELPIVIYTERDLTADQLRQLTLGPVRVLIKSRVSDRRFVAMIRSLFPASPEEAAS